MHNPTPTPTAMQILVLGHRLDPDADAAIAPPVEQDGMNLSRRRARDGTEYTVLTVPNEEKKRAYSWIGRVSTEKKRAASAANGRKFGGRPPATPQGVARSNLRKSLESVFGRPLPKDGPIFRLVSPQSSVAVLRRAWTEVEPQLPEDRRASVGALVEVLVAVLENPPG